MRTIVVCSFFFFFFSFVQFFDILDILDIKEISFISQTDFAKYSTREKLSSLVDATRSVVSFFSFSFLFSFVSRYLGVIKEISFSTFISQTDFAGGNREGSLKL